MGSLSKTGEHISQDNLTTKHTGQCIEVTNVVTDSSVECHSLAEGGEGLN